MRTRSVFILVACVALTGCPDEEAPPDLPIGRGTSPPDGAPHKPTAWDGFFIALQAADVPSDFLSEAERAQVIHDSDPLEGWRE